MNHKHPLLLRHLRARPRLALAVGVGLLLYAALPGAPQLLGATRFLLSWNAAGVLYLVLAGWMMARSTQALMRRRAVQQDEGQRMVLLLVVVSVVASLLAIVAELSNVHTLSPGVRNGHILLTALTIVMSWLFTHLMFALHYAHDYYLNESRGQPCGLDFPGESEPDYGDFLYFAFVIGTSAQTADVTLTSRAMRRTGLLHCVLAFFFNTAVLALTINIGAGLLQG
jgi:uncharacterized membrane protein